MHVGRDFYARGPGEALESVGEPAYRTFSALPCLAAAFRCVHRHRQQTVIADGTVSWIISSLPNLARIALSSRRECGVSAAGSGVFDDLRILRRHAVDAVVADRVDGRLGTFCRRAPRSARPRRKAPRTRGHDHRARRAREIQAASKRTSAPRCATRPAISGLCRNTLNGRATSRAADDGLGDRLVLRRDLRFVGNQLYASIFRPPCSLRCSPKRGSAARTRASGRPSSRRTILAPRPARRIYNKRCAG